ncbi:MAG: FliA/WhiG family RNA polymerase sigma factor [Verrucomicrobiae bacterium]|nr:FliA/WhiG family RNA polymerase sigma factor [Verrucomicrobiae bacterium]
MEALWRGYAENGQGSVEEGEILGRHLHLVRIVVGRIALSLPAHVDTDDLHSVGRVGLLNAIRRFNPHCGAAFETYARLRIRGAVMDELRRLDWVPRSVHEKADRLQQVLRGLEQELGRFPTEEEVAAKLAMTLKDYRQLLLEVRPATYVCLDSVRSMESEDGGYQGEVLPDESVLEPDQATALREDVNLLAERIASLPEVQQKVLALYYYEDLTLREIAEVFGLTESRICQIHGQAVLALRALFAPDEEVPGDPWSGRVAGAGIPSKARVGRRVGGLGAGRNRASGLPRNPGLRRAGLFSVAN